MNEWIGFLGSLQTWPSSASGAGTSTISVPNPRYLGQGGMETAFLDSTGAVGTLLEEADRGQTTALAPGRGCR